MSMNIDHREEYERALIFMKRKILVHVSRYNGLWHNGLILEVNKNFFILKDRVEGKEEFILFEELKVPLEKCKEVGR